MSAPVVAGSHSWGKIKTRNNIGLHLNNRLIFSGTGLGLMMMAASIAPNVSVSDTSGNTNVLLQNIPQVEVVELGIEFIDSKKKISAQEYVEKYFSDIPILVEVARCESHFRQHDKTGAVLRGIENRMDVGVMQINEYYHLKDSKDLGYDIYSIEGNTAYARHLFEKKGVAPWKSSSPCWKNSDAYNTYQQLAQK